jgi:hypothetical protein
MNKWFNPAYWLYAGIGMLIVGISSLIASSEGEDDSSHPGSPTWKGVYSSK